MVWYPPYNCRRAGIICPDLMSTGRQVLFVIGALARSPTYPDRSGFVVAQALYRRALPYHSSRSNRPKPNTAVPSGKDIL